jgi:hypothetical protein
MDKVREFRRRALECANLAQKATTPDIRGHYENLARTWDKLAEERQHFFIERHELEEAGLSSPGALK